MAGRMRVEVRRSRVVARGGSQPGLPPCSGLLPPPSPCEQSVPGLRKANRSFCPNEPLSARTARHMWARAVTEILQCLTTSATNVIR